MEIFTQNTLTAHQTEAVRALEHVVFAHDGLHNPAFLSNEINVCPEMPCFFIGVEDGKVIAFLTLFLPTAQEAEVTAYTHPAHRRRGHFAALLARAADTARSYGIPQLLYAVEQCSADGQAVLARTGHTTFQHAEYRMRCQTLPAFPAAPQVQFARVTQDNIADYEAVVTDVFPDLAGNDAFLQAVLTQPARRGFVGYAEGAPVCAFGLLQEGASTFLYCVGVRAAQRRRGLGKALVRHALEQAPVPSCPVLLDVDSENPPALALYRSCGFSTQVCVEYYAQPLSAQATPG